MEGDLLSSAFVFVIIILSAVVHEYSHAWMANQLGDPTARLQGRLTLNPLKHIEPFGTIILPLLSSFFFNGFFGWAKPVPYNPYNLSDKKNGEMKVALAGPVSNFALALVLGLVLRFAGPQLGDISGLLSLAVFVNIFLGLFNLIPIHPFDGGKVFGRYLPFINNSTIPFPIALFLALIIGSYIIRPLSALVFGVIVGV